MITAVAMQQVDKQTPITTEELLEAVFSVESILRLYNKDTSQATVRCQQFS
jgi:hypothetical protein